MEAKLATKASKSNEPNVSSKRQANPRQLNAGAGPRAANARTGNGSNERDPQGLDLGVGVGGGTIEGRGNSATKRGSQDRKKGQSQDAKAHLAGSSEGQEVTSLTNGEDPNFHLSHKSELQAVAQTSSQSQTQSQNNQAASYTQGSQIQNTVTTAKKKRKNSDKVSIEF